MCKQEKKSTQHVEKASIKSEKNAGESKLAKYQEFETRDET
jgi:hypothetical protein